MHLVIVSGLSGSGKSIALSTLEDSGYYCIDNLPVRLIEPFICESVQGLGKTAISIDCRNLAGNINLFGEALNTLKQFAIPYRILFLLADPQTLINRYSETRRKHPLSHLGNLPLAEAIEQERKLLEPIAACADLIIDTTHTNIHQLRQLVLARLGEDNRQLALCFTSFGFKHGLPLDADFVFDARCLPNPHWEPELRPLTGRDPEVAQYLEKLPETGRFLSQIETFLTTWLPCFSAHNRSYLTIAIGCTGGRHRSVYLAEKLGQMFADLYPVVVRHRELV
ncbi:MAG: RNase adapter RapZ [Methylohalobius sp.]|nr:RNase adapter RapZ [Methylohalobius sp.]